MMAWMLLRPSARADAAATRCSWAWAPARSRASATGVLRMRTHRGRAQPDRHRRPAGCGSACRPTRRAPDACSRWTRRASWPTRRTRQRAACCASTSTTTRPPSPVLDSAAFYRDCRALLADGGVMSGQPVRPRRQLRAQRGAHRRGVRRRAASAACARRSEGNTIVAGAASAARARPRDACRARR